MNIIVNDDGDDDDDNYDTLDVEVMMMMKG